MCWQCWGGLKDARGTQVFKTRFPVHSISCTPSSSLIPFLSPFLFFFSSICRPTPFFQAPKNPRQFFLLHLNPFLKIPNPNHDLNWSKNPNPKIMISAPECHGFDDLGTRGIFSVVGLCFQFFLLHLNPFLKIQNHFSKSQTQITISIGAKTVVGSCFLNWNKNCWITISIEAKTIVGSWFVFSGLVH